MRARAGLSLEARLSLGAGDDAGPRGGRSRGLAARRVLAAGACDEQVRKFRRLLGEEATVTVPGAVLLRREFDFRWARRLLSEWAADLVRREQSRRWAGGGYPSQAEEAALWAWAYLLDGPQNGALRRAAGRARLLLLGRRAYFRREWDGLK